MRKNQRHNHSKEEIFSPRQRFHFFFWEILRPPMPALGAPQGEREGENQKLLILAQKAFL